MKNFLFIFAAIGLVSLSACNRQVKKERIQRIDSLGVHLNYVGERLQELDEQLLENRRSEIDHLSSWVWDNVEDTLPKKQGLAFGDLMRSTKYLKKTQSQYKEVADEYNYSQEQLKTLRKDVENSFYSEEEFNGYFRTEARSIDALVKASDELKTNYEYSNERYEKYKPTVDALVDSIKAVIYSDEPIRK
jgi:peptidoglycan hydrolase CwlO-like protein